MGSFQAKICSCSSYENNENDRKKPQSQNIDGLFEEGMRLSEIEGKNRASEIFDTKQQNIFTSPKIKEHYKAHENLFMRIAAHRQDHILYDVEELKDIELDNFYESLYDIDFELLDMMYNHLILKRELENEDKDRVITPIKNTTQLRNLSNAEYYKFREKGFEMITRGNLGVLILAGGQGSRLGFDHPKGMYNIGMPSQKSLFQYYCEKIKRIARLARINAEERKITSVMHFPIVLYIMTSEMNYFETKDFFIKNKYFGLPLDNVIFFHQQSLPALDLYGKIILEGPNKIFWAPNGSGGLYSSLLKKQSGITHLHIIGVDNVMCKVADPFFAGFAQYKNYDITAKYITRINPKDNVGVHVLADSKPYVIETSVIPSDMANSKDNEGNLIYNLSNINNMIFKLTFLEEIITSRKKELSQRYHISKKKIKYYDNKIKEVITPLENNGYKFELHITDGFLLCNPDKFGLIEAKKSEEYALIKNPSGSLHDCADTARDIMSKLYQNWLESKGIRFKKKASGKPNECCEISSSMVYDYDDFIVDPFKHVFTNVSEVDLPLLLDENCLNKIQALNSNKRWIHELYLPMILIFHQRQ